MRAGQVCHANGTLAIMDTTALHPTCYFPYRQLAAFKSLASLALDYCLPNSQVNSHSCPLLLAHQGPSDLLAVDSVMYTACTVCFP